MDAGALPEMNNYRTISGGQRLPRMANRTRPDAAAVMKRRRCHREYGPFTIGLCRYVAEVGCPQYGGGASAGGGAGLALQYYNTKSGKALMHFQAEVALHLPNRHYQSS